MTMWMYCFCACLGLNFLSFCLHDTGKPELSNSRYNLNKILPCNNNCFGPKSDLFTSFSISKPFLFRP